MRNFEFLRDKPSVVYTWADGRYLGFQLVTAHYGYKDPSIDGPGATVRTAVKTEDRDERFSSGRHAAFVNVGIAERVITTALALGPRTRTVHSTTTNTKHRRFRGDIVTKVPVVETTQIPARALTVGDFNNTDGQKPAFAVGYDLLTRDNRIHGISLDGRGRPGKTLTTAVVLNEVEAQDLTRELMANPRSAREFARYVLRDCVQLSERQCSSPNYEALDERVSHIQFATSVQQSPSEGIVLPLTG